MGERLSAVRPNFTSTAPSAPSVIVKKIVAPAAQRALARWAAGATIFLTITEGALGAVLVKFGLTADSRSPMRAPVEALHFSNTLLLLASLTLVAHLLSRVHGYTRATVRLTAPIGATIAVLIVLIV